MATSPRPFRFGVSLTAASTRQAWLDKCRRAEALGYDLIAVPDHLGVLAPFPALVAAAAVTERPRLATYVLNAAFHNPVLLARDALTTQLVTGGRLELGIGAGYAKDEFEAAGIPWTGAGARVRRLSETVTELRRILDDPRLIGWSRAIEPPPLIIGGHGDKMLRLAAAHADVVAFAGATGGTANLAGADIMAERVAFFEAAAGDRAASMERNIMAHVVIVAPDRDRAIDMLRRRAPHLDGMPGFEELPTVLLGPAEDIAATLLARRERYGISSICVHEPAMAGFASVIKLLAGQ
ncbi:TIGR03621 family F420-dependent LLM class oxidoreductase [Streptomyces sp. L2]|uniref:TIGR03621 family F420-dependent LLM class oxidoreductase n=1 Tax=Streptomyces sp. L2 TaxID=2162665 RepID=UPI0010110CD9|nr:TIGR03621 family F420-dependent LLM class oxidoreductase [Streptomyces sp. L2]